MTPVVDMRNLQDIKTGHVKETAKLVNQVATMLHCKPLEIENMVIAATLHDIGKALMPREILSKPGAFTKAERIIINSHAEIGAELLKSLGYHRTVVEMVKNHHNKQALDLGSQILRACDITSALLERRYYKEPMAPEKVLSILGQENLHKSIVDCIATIILPEQAIA